MKKFRLLLMTVLAAAVAFTACEPKNGETVVAPTVVVTVDEASVTSDGFTAAVVTTDAEKAAWVVVAQGDATVTAAGVLETGTPIPAETLNVEATPATVVVAELEAETAYDFYVAVENKGKKVLSQVVSVTTAAATPAFSKIIEFYPTMCEATSLVDAGVGVGHWLNFMDENYNMMSIVIQDGTTDAMEYKFLQGITYPSATGNVMGGQMPTGSVVVCDPSLSNVSIYDEATDTEKVYFFLGEQGNDATGMPYGVDILTAMPDEDNNMITFNLVAEDEEGNKVLIVGQYTGPFGYPAAAAPIEFDLTEWGYTSFNATKEGNIVTLLSGGPSGDFKLILDTTSYGGQAASADGNLYVVGDNLSGYYFDALDFMDYNFTEGGFVLTKGEKEGEFLLEVGERRGWKMAGGNKQFNIVPKVYTITVTGLEEKEGSEFQDLTNGTPDSEF